jgi:ABC-type lipoprotein export system ATPase subunit
MLTLKNVCKTYTTKKGKSANALIDISLAFPTNGMVFIVGKSGSGKSTLLNVLGGLDSVTSGEVVIQESGEVLEKSVLDAYRNSYLGFVFQEFQLFNNLSVKDNVALSLRIKGTQVTDDIINQALKNVGIEELVDRLPQELSGGQKQRVAIARCLIKEPQIILADEPTGNLDSNTSIEIFEILANIAKDHLVIVVTHDREAALKYGARLIELSDGRIVSDSLNNTTQLQHTTQLTHLNKYSKDLD